MSVRIGWVDDAPAIGAVQAATWKKAYADLLPADVLDQLDADALAARWRDSMTRPTDARHRVLIALDRATVTGFAVTGPASDPDTDPIAVGEIAELAVHPDATGQGHGSRLLQACVDTLRSDKFTAGVIWLSSTDDSCRRFLTAAGWAPDGAHRELDLYGDGAVSVRQVRLHTDLGDPA